MSKRSSKSPTSLSAEGLLIDLANLPDKAVSDFREKWRRWYGRYKDEEILTRRDELRLLWAHRLWEYPPDEVTFVFLAGMSKKERQREATENERRQAEWYAQHPEAIRPTVPKRAKKLFEDWEDHVDYLIRDAPREEPSVLEEVICEHWMKLEPMWWRVIWEKNRKTIGIQPRCLPAMLAQTCLRVVEQLGFCRNPQCARRYFFLQRRDQLYCSPECAKPARRASKLKWWHERRGKAAKGVVEDMALLADPTRPRRSPLRPPLKRKSQGGAD